VTVGADTFAVCEGCASAYESPGRGEGINEDDRALAAVLEHLAGISMEDHWLADESGYVGVFDRYLLVTDDRGFVDVRTYADHAAAMREIDSYEDNGLGADEHDAWISSEYAGYGVSFDGKYVGKYESLRRAQACVSVLMRKHGYFPNVWLDNGGSSGIRRITVW
jgi:hypothetical protein